MISIHNTTDRTAHTGYYLPKGEIKNYYFLIDEKDFFDQPIKSYIKSYKTIGQRDDYTTGCLADYRYLKKNYMMIATDLSRHQALDADPKQYNKY